jgi:adenylate cyclase
MSSDRGLRKLAAIMAADVVGYSRLIENDEARTLAALRTLRISVFDRLVADNRGRIVKLMGDGILVEFNSAVDAVVCATAIQSHIAREQTESASIPPIIFRIGNNLGDVAVDGDDLMGGRR